MKRLCLIGGVLVALLVVSVLAGDGKHEVNARYVTMVTDTADGNGLSDDSMSVVSGTIGLIGNMELFNVLTGKVFIDSSVTTARGFGLDDSVSIYWRTSRMGVARTIAADSCAGLPCSSFVTIPADDTLFFGDLYIDFRITDTLSDSVLTAKPYLFQWDITVRGN